MFIRLRVDGSRRVNGVWVRPSCLSFRGYFPSFKLYTPNPNPYQDVGMSGLKGIEVGPVG